jgi:hypothetical protein
MNRGQSPAILYMFGIMRANTLRGGEGGCQRAGGKGAVNRAPRRIGPHFNHFYSLPKKVSLRLRPAVAISAMTEVGGWRGK